MRGYRILREGEPLRARVPVFSNLKIVFCPCPIGALRYVRQILGTWRGVLGCRFHYNKARCSRLSDEVLHAWRKTTSPKCSNCLLSRSPGVLPRSTLASVA